MFQARRAAVGRLLESFGWSEELGSLPQPAPPLEEVVLRVLLNSDSPLPLAAIQAAVEQDFGRSARGIEKALAAVLRKQDAYQFSNGWYAAVTRPSFSPAVSPASACA